MQKLVDDVRAFHQKFGLIESDQPGHLSPRKFAERVACMSEELDEFVAAGDANNLAEQGDALIDLIYFAVGTGVMLGLPLAKMWDEVQQQNMAKVRGLTKRGHVVDVTKPVGWRPPNHDIILSLSGYNSTEWLNAFNELRPGVSRDDE